MAVADHALQISRLETGSAATSSPAADPVSTLAGRGGKTEHFVLFYRDEPMLMDALSKYVRQGIDEGASVVVIATEAHRHALEKHLGARGVDFGQVVSDGQLVALDAEETLAGFMMNGAPERESFLARVGGLIQAAVQRRGRVFAFGEMVAQLWKRDHTDAAVALEKLWNELVAELGFTLFCAYPIQECGREHHVMPFEAVCANHTRVIPVGNPYPSLPPEQQREIAQLQQKAQVLEKKLEQEMELQAAMAHLAAIVESSDDAIISKTLDGVIRSWNAGAERLFGWAAAEAVGRPITLIIPAERLSEEQHILDTLKRGERIDHFETTRVTKDGRHIDISLTVSPIRNAAGAVIGASKIARDISARKRSEVLLRQQESALQEANAELRESDRRKNEFLALLGHELRNPLTSISTASELLLRTVPEERRARLAVDMIKRQTAQLTRLVDDLLDIGRITQGRMQLQRRSVELEDVIRQALETVEPQLRAKQHDISVVTSTSRPLYVDGDLGRLVQCVVNVLSNAAKYCDPRGKVRIELRPEGQEAVIEVADNGPGIPPELLPKIFDLFVQNDRTLDRSQGGLGIGLSVVKRLIEMHGGRVSARSPGVGQGSTFEIRLPRVEPADSVRPGQMRVKSPARRVLVVDDNVDAATSLAMLLSLQGHQAEAVYGARDALARAESFKPEVALLDIRLPEMDGWSLAQRLRAMPQQHSGLRLIALTGYAQPDDRQRALDAGFDAHLAKPVDMQVLERVLAGMGAEAGTE